MEKVRIGLYGCGNRTVQLMQEAANCPDVQVTLCHDINPERAQKMAERYHAKACTLDELLSSDDVDMYLISLFPAVHTEALLKASQTGKPIYIEKPVAVTADDVAKLAPLVGKSYIQVGLFYNYIPIFRELTRLVKNGTIGELVGINFNWLSYMRVPEDELEKPKDWRHDPQTGGELTQHYCHCFDWFRSLGGNFRALSAMTASGSDNNTCIEDVWDLLIKLDSGAQVSFHSSETNPFYSVHGYLEGREGSLEWEWNNPSRITLYKGTSPSNRVSQVLPVPEKAPDALMDFIHRYQSGEAPAVTLEDGLWSVLPPIYARESAASGKVVCFPEKLNDVL